MSMEFCSKDTGVGIIHSLWNIPDPVIELSYLDYKYSQIVYTLKGLI